MKAPSSYSGRIAAGGAVLGLALTVITLFEGLYPKAYRDPIGVPTVCIGETIGVKMGDVYTVEQCKAMLVKRLPDYEYQMAQCVDAAKLPDKTFVAFLSFTYNVGGGAFCGSTLVRKWNAGDRRGACAELLKWVYAGSQKWQGLVNRRAEENRLCLEGIAS